MSNNSNKIGESSTIPDFNVVIFGSAGVGKSALVRRFLKSNYSEIYQPTVEETYSNVLQTLNGSCLRLVLIDTAGLHPFPAMRELRMRSGSVFLIVFAYDSMESLEDAIKLFHEIESVRGQKLEANSVIFVGNKRDLLSLPFNDCGSSEEEVEDSDDLRSNADAYLAMKIRRQAKECLMGQLKLPFIETSARCGHHVLELFHLILWPTVVTSARLKCVQPAIFSPGYFVDDSPLRRHKPTEFVKKKVSWPWRNSTDHPTTFPMNSHFPSPWLGRKSKSPDITLRRRKISCFENESASFGSEFQRRKLSMGSRIFSSVRNAHVGDLDTKQPASRSRSMDNSLAHSVDRCKNCISSCSVFSEQSFSSNSSIGQNSSGKENIRRISNASSDASSTLSRPRFGNFLTPSPINGTTDCICVKICPTSLDFVKEVGQCLNPTNNPEKTDLRIPQVPFIGRRGKFPQPSWDRKKKGCVFNQAKFSMTTQISELTEHTSLASEPSFTIQTSLYKNYPDLANIQSSNDVSSKKHHICKIS